MLESFKYWLKVFQMKMYDVIIIGAGAAGLNAAVYSTRFKLNTLVISKDVGGAALEASKVGNWLGEKGISGSGLIKRFEEHARYLGVKIQNKEITKIEKTPSHFKVDGEEAKAIIFATGSLRRRLSAKNADKFEGRGISYCTACDAPFFKKKAVAVVGSGDAAATAALHLAEYAEKVYLLVRREAMKAEPVNQESIKKNKKIEIRYKAEISEVFGKDSVEGVILNNGKKLELRGIFIEIGAIPTIELAKNLGVRFNERNEIIVDRAQRTNVSCVYAAGDCTDFPFKQLITAASAGAVASLSCFQDLKTKDR